MKKSTILFLTGALLLASSSLIYSAPVPSAQKKEETLPKAPEIAKISEAFGHLIGKNLETIGVSFDIAQVIKGLQDEAAGKTSPMSEAECVQAISSVQEKIFNEQCEKNLEKAEKFLSSNTEAKEVVALEEGKVQYKIDKVGDGAVIESHFSPLIRYTGKYLDGTIFGSSKEEEMISLDEIIPGLKAGLVGMKEGEKRTVYIHPELAYGTNGYLPPNSLLTFEIEVIKANAPQPQTAESAASSSQKPKSSSEIVEPEQRIR